jgi:arsenate reductase
MHITIYHNPACGTSRNTLALIRNSGIEPTIIDYLRQPPPRETLRELIRTAGLSVRQAVREKEASFAALMHDQAALTDEQWLDAMVAQPILINRPFVVTPLGVQLCRPSELVLEILPQPQRGPFSKEDGEIVVDADGKRGHAA